MSMGFIHICAYIQATVLEYWRNCDVTRLNHVTFVIESSHSAEYRPTGRIRHISQSLSGYIRAHWWIHCGFAGLQTSVYTYNDVDGLARHTAALRTYLLTYKWTYARTHACTQARTRARTHARAHASYVKCTRTLWHCFDTMSVISETSFNQIPNDQHYILPNLNLTSNPLHQINSS